MLVHVSQVFNPWDDWHIQNEVRSRIAGEIALFAAPWVMPLIMLLAGVSAWHSLQRRTNASYIRNRVVRVLIPLVIGTLILSPPQVYLERRLQGQFSGSFFAFYPHFFEGIYPKGNLSWHHLWFLGHLFAYSLIALPLFRYWQRAAGRRTLHWLARICGAPGGLLWLAIPLILERHVLWSIFPERHMLTSDWSNHAMLFVAYVYGFILAGSPWLGHVIDAQWPRALVAGIVGSLFLALALWHDLLPARLPPPYAVSYLAFWTLYAVCAWAWMVALLGASRRWLHTDSPLIGYGRRVGYGLYILHQPIIVAVAFVVVGWQLPVVAKYAIILISSTVGTLVAAEVLSRIPLVRVALGVSPPARLVPPLQV